MREDASGWKTLCIAVSEAIGTAILVFVGCTGCIGSLGVHPNLMQISLAFGLGAMIAIQVSIRKVAVSQSFRATSWVVVRSNAKPGFVSSQTTKANACNVVTFAGKLLCISYLLGYICWDEKYHQQITAYA